MNSASATPRKTGRRRALFTVPALCLALAWTNALQANVPHVISPSSGEKIEGRGIRRDETGGIILRTASGELTFPEGVIFYVPEPPEYGRALNHIQQRNFEAAIRTLEELIEKFADLQWDRRARVLLAGAHYDKGEFDRAADFYARVEQENSEALDDMTVLNRYLDALQKSDREEALMRVIRDTVRTRSRPAAARAQMMRGRIHLEKNAVELALLDFLRTAEMFVDVEDFQEEAIARSAQAFERLDDPRAEDYFTRLREKYPDSRYLEN